MHSRDSRGGAWRLLVGFLGVAAVRTLLGREGGAWRLLTGLVAVAVTYALLLLAVSCCVRMLVGKEPLIVVLPPLLVHPPLMAVCLSGVPRLLLCTPLVATVQPLQAVSAQPILYLDLTSEA